MYVLTHLRRRIATLALLAAGVINVAQAEQMALEVYPTFNQAHRVAAAIAPLLNERETLSVHGNQLIIRATDATHDKILALLDQIDRPPRQMLVSLRQTDQRTQPARAPSQDRLADSREGVRIQRTERPDEIIVYRGASSDGQISIHTRAAQIHSTRPHGIVQQLQVTEGENGFMAAREQQPWSLRVARNPDNPAQLQTELHNGFYVRPVISQDGQIVVEINQQHTERHSALDKVITTYQTLTTVRVSPSAWTPVSAVSKLSTTSSNTKHYRTQNVNLEQQGLEIRVDIVD